MNEYINKFNKKYNIEIISVNSKLSIKEKLRLKILIKYGIHANTNMILK